MTNYDKSIGSALADMVLKLGEIKAVVVELPRERDEARAELATAQSDIEGLTEQVERLRAAQQSLPDVGPVTRDEDGTIRVDGYDFVDSDLPHDPQVIRAAAARTLAVAAFLDAEAADTSSDDEVDQVIAEGVSELREHDWPSEELIERVLRRVASRARGGQEASQ